MISSSNAPTSPEGIPDHLVVELTELTPEELRNTIVHAQELLRFQEETSSPIEPGPGEDIIRTTEHKEHTEIVKQYLCAEGCGDCPHGPYLYHVREEARPKGEQTFIGHSLL